MLNGSDATYSSTTNEYASGSWTAGGSLNTARRWVGTAGSQTAGLAFGGQIPPSGYSTNATEEYDGSSWTAGGNLNVTRAVNAVGGGINQDASQTNALASGGYQSSGSPKTYFNETEAYDGTTWATKPSMTAARGYGTGGGSGTAGISVGAFTGSLTTATEEFTTSIYSPVAATWASGATMNTQGTNSGGFGTMSAGALASTGPGTGYETYDGSTWTAQPSLNTTRTGGTAGAGSISAGLAAGGGTPTVSSANSEEYNGSSWSEGNNLGTARGALASANSGSQTAALAFSGETNPGGTLRAQTEAYDGTSWTEQNDLSDARFGGAGAGTQTAGLMMGGNPTTPGFSTATEEYNGTSWTSGGALNTGRRDLNGAGNGTQTSALVYGGEASPGFTTATEEYNGTAWSNTANLATAAGVRSGFNSGGNTAAIAAGPSLSTEEYTGVTQVLDYKTITTS